MNSKMFTLGRQKVIKVRAINLRRAPNAGHSLMENLSATECNSS